MAKRSYNISFALNNVSFMAKLDKKPVNKPAPDPKPHEGSGHSDKGNGSKSN